MRREGDWEAWIAFFLEGVAQIAGSAVEMATRLLALFREDGERVRGQGGRTVSSERAFDALRAQPVTTIRALARRTDMSYPTAAKSVATLTDLGLLREITGRRRDRIFAYGRYLRLLGEGAESL